MNYMSKDDFWNIYQKDKYHQIKEKYDTNNYLLDIYNKVCSFYLELLRSSNLNFTPLKI